MIFHETRLLADDSHVISYLIFCRKLGKMSENFSSTAVVIDALRVNTLSVMSNVCRLVVTCWERADLLALLCVTFSCAFVTFPYGVLGQVWNLIVSIPDLCLLSFFLS